MAQKRTMHSIWLSVCFGFFVKKDHSWQSHANPPIWLTPYEIFGRILGYISNTEHHPDYQSFGAYKIFDLSGCIQFHGPPLVGKMSFIVEATSIQSWPHPSLPHLAYNYSYVFHILYINTYIISIPHYNQIQSVWGCTNHACHHTRLGGNDKDLLDDSLANCSLRWPQRDKRFSSPGGKVGVGHLGSPHGLRIHCWSWSIIWVFHRIMVDMFSGSMISWWCLNKQPLL